MLRDIKEAFWPIGGVGVNATDKSLQSQTLGHLRIDDSCNTTTSSSGRALEN